MKQELINITEKLEGFHSIEDVQELLNVNRARAIHLMHTLRNKGFVKTKRTSAGKRYYHISFGNAVGGTSYIEVLNKYAPVPLASFETHKLYGKVISVEETLIYALKKDDIRHVIASLSLFKHIKNWSLLYNLAKKEGLNREICALYDVAKKTVKKIRRMPDRFKKLGTPKKNSKYKYIINLFSSDDFKKIERKWKVYIPLNIADLNEYRGFNT